MREEKEGKRDRTHKGREGRGNERKIWRERDRRERERTDKGKEKQQGEKKRDRAGGGERGNER